MWSSWQLPCNSQETFSSSPPISPPFDRVASGWRNCRRLSCDNAVLASTRWTENQDDSVSPGNAAFPDTRPLQHVRLSAFALDRAIQKISASKPDSRADPSILSEAPTGRIRKFGCFHQFSTAAIQHPVMVITSAEMKLCIVVVDPRSHRGRLAKIKWSRFYRLYSPVGINPASTGVNREAWRAS